MRTETESENEFREAHKGMGRRLKLVPFVEEVSEHQESIIAGYNGV